MPTLKGLSVALAVLSATALLGVLLAACQRTSGTTEERSTEPMATMPAVRTTAIPPLDLAAPAHTETATFALG